MKFPWRSLRPSFPRMLVAVLGGAAAVCSPACNGEITSGDPNGDGGTGGGGGNGDGGLDLRGVIDRDAACASVRAEATLTKKPVDIIVVIDNSGSMTEEIVGVQDNINDNFATVLDKSGLDYRVILIGDYFTSVQPAEGAGANPTDKLSICISTPLGGACS